MKDIKMQSNLLEGNFALTEKLILDFGGFDELKLFQNSQI